MGIHITNSKARHRVPHAQSLAGLKVESHPLRETRGGWFGREAVNSRVWSDVPPAKAHHLSGVAFGRARRIFAPSQRGLSGPAPTGPLASFLGVYQ